MQDPFLFRVSRKETRRNYYPNEMVFALVFLKFVEILVRNVHKLSLMTLGMGCEILSPYAPLDSFCWSKQDGMIYDASILFLYF
jgi:hypothetical protein